MRPVEHLICLQSLHGLLFCLIGYFFKLPRPTPPFWVDHNLKNYGDVCVLAYRVVPPEQKKTTSKLYLSAWHHSYCVSDVLGLNLKFENCLIQSKLRIQRHIIVGLDSSAIWRTWLSKAFKYIFISLQAIVCERHCSTSNFAAGHKHSGLKIIFTSLHRDTQISAKNMIRMLLAIARSNYKISIKLQLCKDSIK